MFPFERLLKASNYKSAMAHVIRHTIVHLILSLIFIIILEHLSDSPEEHLVNFNISVEHVFNVSYILFNVSTYSSNIGSSKGKNLLRLIKFCGFQRRILVDFVSACIISSFRIFE